MNNLVQKHWLVLGIIATCLCLCSDLSAGSSALKLAFPKDLQHTAKVIFGTPSQQSDSSSENLSLAGIDSYILYLKSDGLQQVKTLMANSEIVDDIPENANRIERTYLKAERKHSQEKDPIYIWLRQHMAATERLRSLVLSTYQSKPFRYEESNQEIRLAMDEVTQGHQILSQPQEPSSINPVKGLFGNLFRSLDVKESSYWGMRQDSPKTMAERLPENLYLEKHRLSPEEIALVENLGIEDRTILSTQNREDIIRLGRRKSVNFDFSRLNPPSHHGSTLSLWKAPNMDQFDPETGTFGAERAQIFHSLFPPDGVTVDFDDWVISRGESMKIKVTYKRPDGKKVDYRLKIRNELHSEVIANRLSAAFGFRPYPIKYLRNVTVRLPKKMSFQEFTSRWIQIQRRSENSPYRWFSYGAEEYRYNKETHSVLFPEATLRAYGSQEDGYMYEKIGRFHWNKANLPLKRETRGFLTFAAFVSLSDFSESKNTGLYLEFDGPTQQWGLFRSPKDVGYTMGSLFWSPGKMNLNGFGEKIASKTSNGVRLKWDHYNYSEHDPFLFRRIPTISDLKWGARQLAPLSQADYLTICKAGGLPPAVDKLCARKLIARRNNLMEVFELAQEGGIYKQISNYSLSEISQESVDPNAQNLGRRINDKGVIVVDDWTTHKTRFKGDNAILSERVTEQAISGFWFLTNQAVDSAIGLGASAIGAQTNPIYIGGSQTRGFNTYYQGGHYPNRFEVVETKPIRLKVSNPLVGSLSLVDVSFSHVRYKDRPLSLRPAKKFLIQKDAETLFGRLWQQSNRKILAPSTRFIHDVAYNGGDILDTAFNYAEPFYLERHLEDLQPGERFTIRMAHQFRIGADTRNLNDDDWHILELQLSPGSLFDKETEIEFRRMDQDRMMVTYANTHGQKRGAGLAFNLIVGLGGNTSWRWRKTEVSSYEFDFSKMTREAADKKYQELRSKSAGWVLFNQKGDNDTTVLDKKDPILSQHITERFSRSRNEGAFLFWETDSERGHLESTIARSDGNSWQLHQAYGYKRSESIFRVGLSFITGTADKMKLNKFWREEALSRYLEYSVVRTHAETLSDPETKALLDRQAEIRWINFDGSKKTSELIELLTDMNQKAAMTSVDLGVFRDKYFPWPERLKNQTVELVFQIYSDGIDRGIQNCSEPDIALSKNQKRICKELLRMAKLDPSKPQKIVETLRKSMKAIANTSTNDSDSFAELTSLIRGPNQEGYCIYIVAHNPLERISGLYEAQATSLTSPLAGKCVQGGILRKINKVVNALPDATKIGIAPEKIVKE